MLELLIGSFLLSLLHALIPTHWAPVLAIARSRQWTLPETLRVTLLSGLSHVASTVGLGVLLGMVGLRVTASYYFFAEVVVPLLLIGLGLLYVGLDGYHAHSSSRHMPAAARTGHRSKGSIVFALCLAMLLSPCLEIETYYFKAGTFGWPGIGLVSVVYLVITVSGMLLLVTLGYRGLSTLRGGWLARHEKKLTGSVLILLGLLSYFLH